MTGDSAILAPALQDRSTWRTNDHCPVVKAMEVVGTRSAIIIIREALYGTTRFDDFAERVGITEAVAATRLRELTELGVLERHPYRDPGQRTRHEYRLTPMGRDLAPVVLGLYQWGARYLSPDGPPLAFRHHECGEPVSVAMGCAAGHDLDITEVEVAPHARRTTSRS
jgi:DNA-binding HxlR family transcriptional regulator